MRGTTGRQPGRLLGHCMNTADSESVSARPQESGDLLGASSRVLALLALLVLVVAACDTPPVDAPTIENGSSVGLEIFEMAPSGEELSRGVLMPGSIFSTSDECAGPFVIRTPDGAPYIEVPTLCRGDAAVVITRPDPGD